MHRTLLLVIALAVPAAALARREPDTLVALRGRDEPGLRALLARQQDPRNPAFARWLTPVEYGRRFGAPGRDLRRASRWLRARGCRVRRFASRQLLGCAGVHLDDTAPLAPLVADVIGPGEGPPVRTHLTFRPLITIQGVFLFTPDEFALVYNLTPIRAAGIDGAGQRIGIASFSAIDPADVNTFRARFGLPPLALAQVGSGHLPNTRSRWRPCST